MGERVFVTGASGRIGLPLIRALIAEGHQVVGLARSEQKAATVRETGAQCLVGDLSQRDVVAKGAADAAIIYHLAGGVRRRGAQTPDVLNNQGTQQLLTAIGTAPALRALVFTSTCAVYGDRSNLWVSEDIPPSPNTDYGKSKVAAEEALLASGLPVKIIRLAAVYGPGFPFMMAERIVAGRGWLPGEGRNYIPTIHIDDAVAGIQHIAQHGEAGEIYHLADQEPALTRDFYTEVHRLVGGKPLRFWSTWIPSYIQRRLARKNEQIQARLNRHPRFTPDNLKLYANSVRLKVDRLEKELNFTWRYPTYTDGLPAALRQD